MAGGGGAGEGCLMGRVPERSFYETWFLKEQLAFPKGLIFKNDSKVEWMDIVDES